MSIGTDVARIKGNITAALAAIADKGVTVPAGSTSDALAGLIASIEAGGGGSNNPLSNIAYGDITVNAPYSMTSLKIMSTAEWEALYGEFPNTFYGAIFDVNASEIKSGYFPLFIASATINNTPVVSYMTVYSSNKISYSDKTNAVAQKNTSNNFIQLLCSQNSTYTFKTGRTYKWVILW